MVAASAGEFLGDSLQRIDAAQPHHDLLTTELVNRLGEPLGDLTLLSDRQLVLGCLELRGGRPEVVLERVTVELQLPPGDVGAEQ